MSPKKRTQDLIILYWNSNTNNNNNARNGRTHKNDIIIFNKYNIVQVLRTAAGRIQDIYEYETQLVDG